VCLTVWYTLAMQYNCIIILIVYINQLNANYLKNKLINQRSNNELFRRSKRLNYIQVFG